MNDRTQSNSRPQFAFLGIIIDASRRTLKALFAQKLGWKVIPLLALLFALALILSIGTQVPVIAPFVYALF